MMLEAPLLTSTDQIGPYFEMLVSSESGYPPGGESTAVCTGCGRESIDDDRRQIVTLPAMWNGHEIFTLATTLYIIVTDEIKQELERLRVTNVAYRNCEKAR